MAPSEALRTRSKSTDKQSILAERAALTRQTLGSAYLICTIITCMPSAVRHSRLVMVGRCLPDHGHRPSSCRNSMCVRSEVQPAMRTQRSKSALVSARHLRQPAPRNCGRSLDLCESLHHSKNAASFLNAGNSECSDLSQRTSLKLTATFKRLVLVLVIK